MIRNTLIAVVAGWMLLGSTESAQAQVRIGVGIGGGGYGGGYGGYGRPGYGYGSGYGGYGGFNNGYYGNRGYGNSYYGNSFYGNRGYYNNGYYGNGLSINLGPVYRPAPVIYAAPVVTSGYYAQPTSTYYNNVAPVSASNYRDANGNPLPNGTIINGVGTVYNGMIR